MFSGSKKKEPRYTCLSETKASHPHRTWTSVCSSVPQLKFATSSGSKKRNPVPSKGSHPMCSPSQGPYGERCFISRANDFSFIYICQSPQKGALPQNAGKAYTHYPWIHMRMEGLHTMGCGLVPQGDRIRHCYHHPSAMQPSARYLPSWLG